MSFSLKMPGAFPEAPTPILAPAPPRVPTASETQAAFAELPFRDVFDAPETHASFSNASYSELGRELGPCQHGRDCFAPLHAPLPLSREEILTCMAIAADISGMPIAKEPKFCMPNFSDFGISVAQDRHYDAFSLQFDRREKHKKGLGEFATSLRFSGAAAVYAPTSNTILFEPAISTMIGRFGDHWPLKSVLIHEMAHAAQAQNYPEIFVPHREIKKQVIATLEKPVLGLAGLLEVRKEIAAIGKDALPAQLLFEGHAQWVQTLAGERIYKASSKPLHRLGYQAWSLHNAIGSYWPRPDVYTAGHNMILAVEKLQVELEAAPFMDAAGRAVTLDPTLKNHGLVHLLFKNPEMVRSLLPYYESGWRRSVRERADIRPMRQFVMSLPGHVPLRNAD